MPINDWPLAERPREKLLERGAAALSDAELLAIFLRTGIRGKSAVDMARELLLRFGSLNRLFSVDESTFSAMPGLGPAKYAQFAAVAELGRRILAEEMERGDALQNPSAVRDFLRLSLGGREREVFVAVFLSVHSRVLGVEELFSGSLSEARVHPREVVKAALRHNAAAVIVAHNHPSGVAEPSPADRLLTRQLADALALVEVRLLDHFVIAGNRAESFAERGWL